MKYSAQEKSSLNWAHEITSLTSMRVDGNNEALTFVESQFPEPHDQFDFILAPESLQLVH